jgi:hypothetical protein
MRACPAEVVWFSNTISERKLRNTLVLEISDHSPGYTGKIGILGDIVKCTGQICSRTQLCSVLQLSTPAEFSMSKKSIPPQLTNPPCLIRRFRI